MFSFINSDFLPKIKLLAVNTGAITALNLPSVMIDYTNALELVFRLFFTVSIGVLTLRHTWRKTKANGKGE